MPNTKVATCCYCGSRAALVLTGQTRHELACATCGAPLHVLKRLHPVTDEKKPKPSFNPALFKSKPKQKQTQKKRKKSLMKRVFSELEDVIDDIFD